MTNSLRPSTQDAILEAAFQVLSKDPSASLNIIAERAGVGRATLHRYYASRDALIGAMARTAMKELDTVIETACAEVISYGDALQRTLEALIPLGDRHSFLATEVVSGDAELDAAYKAGQDETRDWVVAAKKEGVFDTNVPTAWIVEAYDHLLYAAWESVKAGEITRTQASELAWRTLTLGLGKAIS